MAKSSHRVKAALTLAGGFLLLLGAAHLISGLGQKDSPAVTEAHIEARADSRQEISTESVSAGFTAAQSEPLEKRVAESRPSLEGSGGARSADIALAEKYEFMRVDEDSAQSVTR